MPRMTAAQRTAIAAPAVGLLVYQTDAPKGFYCFNTVWELLATDGNAANKSLSNLNAVTQINADLLPMNNGVTDLGSPTYAWRDFYMSR